MRPTSIHGETSLNSSGAEKLSDKICKENQSMHFVSNTFFSHENYFAREMIARNVTEQDRPKR